MRNGWHFNADGRRRWRPSYHRPGLTPTLLLTLFAGGMAGANCVDLTGGYRRRGTAPVLTDEDHILGSTDAKVTVVSFECLQ